MTGSSPAAEKPRDAPYSSGHNLHLQRLPIITSLRYRFFLATSAVVFVFLQFFFSLFLILRHLIGLDGMSDCVDLYSA